MTVFFDLSQQRKWFFRGAAIFLYLILFSGFFLILANLFLPSHNRPTVGEDTVARYYHYYYSAASTKKIALTIDDGPQGNVTREMMDLLEKHEAPATFFFIGQKALIRPDLVLEVKERGFDIGSHSFTHQPDAHGSKERLAFELKSSSHLLSEITGEEIRYYRPPFLLGIGIDPTLNPYIPVPEDVRETLSLGYIPVGSDIDPHDWLATSSDEIITNFKKALATTKNGHIVLLHEDPLTKDSLESIILAIRESGYTIVPLDELLIPQTSVALTSNLKTGDTDTTSNGEVSKLQWFLFETGFLDHYAVTGRFDDTTEQAVTAFQLSHGIIDPTDIDPAVVGITDSHTRTIIKKASQSLPDRSLSEKTAISRGDRIAASVSATLRAVYIDVFPVARSILSFVIVSTFIIVIVRLLSLVALIIVEKIQYKYFQPSALKNTKVFRAKNHGWISILIPAYNEEENIRSTIESALKSSYAKKEIIVIDDGSRDNTAAVVQATIDDHPKSGVRLLKKENGGKATALNLGVKHAKYGLIAVLDADAVLHPDALEYFIPHFKDSTIGAVAGKIRTTSASTFLDACQTVEYAVGQNIEKRAFSVLSAVGIVPGPAGAWRKKDILSVGGFSEDTLVEDQDMTLAILRMGKKVIYEPRAISYTETPHKLKDFLKQRFRWIYGTMQCFWKHKRIFAERPGSRMSLIVMPNVFIFNILLPLTYPFADSALIIGMIFGDFRSLILPFVLLTSLDVLYVLFGVWQEPNGKRTLWVVPLQRIIYRQLLYYTVIKSVVRAIEGTGAGWNKFKKSGETQKFFYKQQEKENAVSTALSNATIDASQLSS